MASTYLTRTISDGSNTKSTFSAWVKRSGLGVTSSTQYLFHTSENSNNDFKIIFNSADNFRVIAVVSSSEVMNVSTNRKFTDTSAWYHFVVTIDTTESTAADRVKIYVNGVQETSFSASTYPAEDYSSHRLNNNGDRRTIGTIYDGGGSAGSGYFDGLMSHVYWVDGTAYQASTFGSTDTTTGEWKINTSPTLTMGTNGFTILKDGNTITDQSANSNDFTLGAGTLTKTEDNPSNVFNVWNSNYLTRHHNESTSIPKMLQNGNATFNSTANAFYGYKAGTIGVTKGKFYWECKVMDNGRFYTGICYPNILQGINTPWYDSTTYSAAAFNNNGTFTGRFISGSTYDEFATGTSISNNDIVGFALDMDNKALYAHKNGTYFAVGGVTGVPTSGSSRTGSLIEGFTGTRDDYLNTDFVAPFVGDPSSSGTHLSNFNFGNGYFGSTQISSAGTNASGLGIFEYDVPAGYTALCTKGLNE